ncbi:hypothetical protein SELMODRAFT_414863 [Selaginella moellendorffii]|uniref:F-box domain-containing protein n=1 Tax=Selaginella moellendorffii TaxID=88036 RepID=D8RUW1_SELML|nr:hypothetical protein SELMODRAFT_414863 [Selaginella moellendorffii]
MELDDSFLVDVFTKVGDARELAKCSLVCKRWSKLRWAVSRLCFGFAVNGMEELRNAEDAISSVLHHTKYKAPNCLKELSIVLHSLTTLSLNAFPELISWGPFVWALIAFSTTIRRLEIIGRMRTSNQSLVWCSLKCLEMCELCSPVSHVLLQMLLASCPRLEGVNAVVDGAQSLTVLNGSLVGSLMLCGELGELTVDAPKLDILLVGLRRTSIWLRSQDLRMAVLYNSCRPCETLRSLTLMGSWAMDTIVQLSSLDAFAPFLHGDHGRYVILSFVPDGVSKCNGLTVHLFVWGTSTPPNEMVLRDLLEFHQVKEFVIHCTVVAQLTLTPGLRENCLCLHHSDRRTSKRFIRTCYE